MELLDQIRSAQAGDEPSLQALLFLYGYRKRGRWGGFLGKYEKLLWHGRVDFRNKDTRRFLQLYTKKESTRQKLTYRYQDYQTTMDTQELANYLQNTVQAHYERLDLRQDLVLLFLECLERYEERPGVTFSGYLSNYYRYRLYHHLQKTLFSYDISLQAEPLLEEIPMDDEKTDPEEGVFDHLHELEKSRDELGVFWTNGRCGPLFSSLTTFERILLRDRYFLKKTDLEIARTYGYHRNTIANKRNRALEKLNKKRELP